MRIPAVPALFGIGAFIGLSVGGRISDRRPHAALLSGAAAIAIESAALLLALQQSGAAAPAVFLPGISITPLLRGDRAHEGRRS